jgi:hypothetical protein
MKISGENRDFNRQLGRCPFVGQGREYASPEPSPNIPIKISFCDRISRNPKARFPPGAVLHQDCGEWPEWGKGSRQGLAEYRQLSADSSHSRRDF